LKLQLERYEEITFEVPAPPLDPFNPINPFGPPDPMRPLPEPKRPFEVSVAQLTF